MKGINTSDFLGFTSKKHETDSLAISLVSYREKVSEDWHYHENIHLSSILVGGNRESRKNKDITVVPGKLLTYREGEIHRNRNTAHPSLNLNIEFLPNFFNDQLRLSNLREDEIAYLSILKIYYELAMNDYFSAQSILEIVTSLFYKSDTSRPPEWINELKSLLNDRWDEFISLEEISNELGLHPVSISKGFSKYAGQTLSNYMRLVKVKKATQLVLGSKLPLTEIAHTCGFSDQSHMYRLFTLYTGFNPKSLRKTRSRNRG